MGMKIFNKLDEGFVALSLRDQVLVVAAVTAVLVLGGHLLLLKPQTLLIADLKAKDTALAGELTETKKALVLFTNQEEKGIDPLAAERATLAALEAEIAKAGALLGSPETSASKVGILVRELIKNNPGLTLVSLKTRPGLVFYTPPAPPPPKEQPKTEVEKVLAQLKKDKEESKSAPAVVIVNKPLYKHGVDVSVKGTYPALMAYLENMQKFPQRIFWSEASLEASNYREATLKLLVYTLSDQPTPPLN